MHRIPIMQEQIKSLNNRMTRLEIYGIASIAIALIKMVSPPMAQPATQVVPPSNNSSVQISAESAKLNASQKEFLTSADVAAKESVSERTVISYIEAQRIDPPPMRFNGSRAWSIHRDYRILPQNAAVSR